MTDDSKPDQDSLRSYHALTAFLLSLNSRDIEEVVMRIPVPMPSAISLDALREMKYSEPRTQIWVEKRGSRQERAYCPRENNTTSPRYSRRIDQGARD